MPESLTRKALYELVWKKPITEIAKQYGLSDRGLGKLCERNGIPVPPRGYWAKIKSGQKLKKPPLLFSDSSATKAILEKRISPKLPDQTTKEEKLPQEVVESMEREKTPEYRIKAPKSLTKYHPIISKWNNENDYYGHKQRLTGIERRSRIILSILLNALEERHFEISQNRNYGRFIQIKIDQDFISIAISEYIKRTRREITQEEKANSYYSNQKYTYDNENTGKLSLTIFDNYDKSRNNYTETDEKAISEMLNEIVAGIIEQIWYVKKCRLIQEERERKEWERQRLAWEEEARRKEEEEKFKHLEKQAENWNKAKKIREFITEVKAAFCNGCIDKSEEEFEEWTKWALSHADNLDPLK